METLFFICGATLILSGISAGVSILALIFKKTRLYKAKRLETLNKDLTAAEKKLASIKTAWEKGDEGLKLVMSPMLEEAKANVESIKKEIESVEHKKKFR